MKSIREQLLKAPGSLAIVLMALVFFISISTHNHGIANESECGVQISETAPENSHHVVDCSACLIQGNVKLPDTEPAINAPAALIVNTIEEIDCLIPDSFLKLNKPSRSPPIV